jgi:hypothetical protein
MSTYGPTYGVPGSATYSTIFNSFDQMMAAFLDNTSNLIQAKDVRDMILTLWNQFGVTGSVTADELTYTSASSSTVTIGGLQKGSLFGSGRTLQNIFDTMFFPYVAPTASVALSYNNGVYSNILIREYGSLTSSFYISWNITPGSFQSWLPTSIQFSGANITYNGDNPPIYPPVTGLLATQSGLITIPSNTDTVITLTVNDNTSTYTFTSSVVFQNKLYWGSISTFSTFNSADILGLTGVPGWYGSTLSSNRVSNFDGFDAGGQYIVFAMPTNFGTPSFLTNGLVNTAFSSQVLNFTNSQPGAYAASYSVWYSNTPQYSPITLFRIN